MAGWLQVDEERIIALTDEELRAFMRELLCATARQAGCDISKVVVNARTKAKDKGCDGITPPPAVPHPWLKDAMVCWQLKAGEASQPNKLTKEVSNPIPTQTLKSGGWLIVVASACSNGEAGRSERESKLRDSAEALSLPTERIIVYSADQLAQWASEHPAAATLLYNVTQSDILTHEHWSKLPAHRVPFTPAGRLADQIAELCAEFLERPFLAGEPRIAYILGQHGSGKTRFALEAAKTSHARHNTVYLPSATREIIGDIANYMLNNERATLTIIADDIMADRQSLDIVERAVSRLDGRLRALVITHHADDRLSRDAPRFERNTTNDELTSIVAGWYPGMPREHVSFVVAVSEHSVRLARLVSDAVDRGEIRTASDLFLRRDVRALMERILGGSDKASLAVAAIADSVGWDGPAEHEGQMITEQFGLNWGDVRAAVQDAHERLGIVPRARYRRYVTPGPLGLYLASFAWQTYPGKLRVLARELPEPGRERLLARFQELGSNPVTGQVAREEVEQLRALDDFRDEGRTRLFRAIAAVQPGMAARRLREVLEATDRSDVESLRGSARRELVWELERLSWHRDTFDDAVRSLAALAAAENESIANNATAIFLERFQLFLGGTAVPYHERLPVLDQLWRDNRRGVRDLVLHALSVVTRDHHTRLDTGVSRDRIIEPEWHPRTNREHFLAVQAALDRLLELLAEQPPEPSIETCVTVVEAFVPLLAVSTLRERCVALIERVLERAPSSREQLRLAVKRHLRWLELHAREGEVDEDAAASSLEVYRRIHDRLSDPSLFGRLRQLVGEPPADSDDDSDGELSRLAAEVVETPGVLDAPEAQWLVGGNAIRAWALGKALGEADHTLTLLDPIWRLSREADDMRLLGGYLFAARARMGQDWADAWLDARVQDAPERVFDATLRLGAEGRALARVRDLLAAGAIGDRFVSMLEYGWFLASAPLEEYRAILSLLAQRPEWRPIALSIAAHHVKKREELRTDPEFGRIALSLLTDTGIITSRRSSSGDYWWTELARVYVERDAVPLVRTLLDAHLGKDESSHTWFLEHSQCRSILSAAMGKNPQATWTLISEKLETDGFHFTIGFPEGIVDRAPFDDVMAWLSEAPEKRVPLIARIVHLRFDDDGSLVMGVIDAFAHLKRADDAFMMALGSGSWVGELSAKYDGLAVSLDESARRTKLPNARTWLRKAADEMRLEAGREREREAEERLLWR